MERKFKVNIQLNPFNYDDILAINKEQATDKATAIIEERYPWAEIDTIKANEEYTAMSSELDLEKNFIVDIRFKPFNYDDILADDEDKAIAEATAIIEERYPWAEIEAIKASESLNSTYKKHREEKMNLDKVKQLDVQYIVFKGYYSNEDDGYELHEHTKETLSLYFKGYTEAYKGNSKDNEDTFNGVCFDADNFPLAEWQIDGIVRYFKIPLN